MTSFGFPTVFARLALIGLMALMSGSRQIDAELAEPAAQGDLPLLPGIVAGDPGAIAQARRSANRAYIPALQVWTQGRPYPGYTDRSATEQARLALAKLGVSIHLQEYWCAAVSDAPNERALNPPIELFEFIGGWLSVRVLSYFFEPNSKANWSRAFERMAANWRRFDVEYPQPLVRALRTSLITKRSCGVWSQLVRVSS
jgi:hypothetical protein